MLNQRSDTGIGSVAVEVPEIERENKRLEERVQALFEDTQKLRGRLQPILRPAGQTISPDKKSEPPLLSTVGQSIRGHADAVESIGVTVREILETLAL